MADKIDLTTPEAVEAIAAAAELLNGDELSALKKNKGELLTQVRKLRAQSTIDPGDHSAALEKIGTLEGELSTLKNANTTLTKASEKLQGSLDSETKFSTSLLVKNGLTDALTKANVRPELADAARSMLSSMVTIKTDGDKRNAFIGDKPLDDHVKEWSESDAGKPFIAAPGNSGAGGHNSSSESAAPNALPMEQFDQLTPAEKMAHTKDGGTVTN